MPTRIADKMGIKKGEQLFIANAPPECLRAIDLPPVSVAKDLSGTFDHIIFFVKTQADMEAHFAHFKSHLAPTGKLWITWPKKGHLETNLDLKKVIHIGYNYGLVESTNLRIDDTWTSLKFTRPKPGKEYNNKYGRLRR